jgi:3-oxoacyl-[acyl-carrier-protein] synthase II
MTMDKRRVVVTGMGAITPIGHGVGAFWENLIAGRSGVDLITLFDCSALPCKIGAEVKKFCAFDYGISPKLERETDRFIQFALAAASEAIEESGLKLDLVDPYRIGVVFGTTMGGLATITEAQTQLLSTPGSRVTPHLMPKMLPNLAAAQIGIRHGIRGPSLTISTACATGSDVVGTAANLLRSGTADVIIAGASDCLYCQLVYGSLSSARAMSTRNEDPATASRPFDLLRSGFVMGEGSGVVVLETFEHVHKRNGHVWGEIIGYANCGDGFHTTAPRPDGEGQIYCMRQALASAGLNPDEIDYVNAHATSTPQGDRVETIAVKRVFGARAYQLPISSIKGATGHMMAGAGIVELIASLKSIREGIIPPTINYENRDPDCDLNYIPNHAQRIAVNTVLSNSFGFGGQNASIVVRGM